MDWFVDFFQIAGMEGVLKAVIDKLSVGFDFASLGEFVRELKVEEMQPKLEG